MLKTPRVVREGFAAGLIGAGSVAVWFLIVDVVAGRPFFTPAVLGSAAFHGLRDPANVVIGPQAVWAYTAMHVLLFLFVGLIASAMVSETKKSPQVVWLLIEFFIVFQFGFYAAVAIVFAPLLAALAWINVAVGNLIAAVGMGYYLWRAHPELRERLMSPGAEPPEVGDGAT
jgi:hypothetical protein